MANNAVFVSQSVPAQMVSGRFYAVSITMKNTGTTPWTRATAYRLGAQSPQDTARWGATRVELAVGESVQPGATKRFDFQVRAPSTAGTHPFQWRMLREFVEWFGAFTPVVNVAVAVSDTLRVKYRYHVIGCGYPRYSRDTPADAVNARWPEFGYWKNGVVGGTWMAKAQNTTEYGRRTLGFCRDNSIRILTGWWDINDRAPLANTIAAFREIDLKNEPLRLAYMFGAQNFKNPNTDPRGMPLDSTAVIAQMVRDHWAPAAANPMPAGSTRRGSPSPRASRFRSRRRSSSTTSPRSRTSATGKASRSRTFRGRCPSTTRTASTGRTRATFWRPPPRRSRDAPT